MNRKKTNLPPETTPQRKVFKEMGRRVKPGFLFSRARDHERGRGC